MAEPSTSTTVCARFHWRVAVSLCPWQVYVSDRNVLVTVSRLLLGDQPWIAPTSAPSLSVAVRGLAALVMNDRARLAAVAQEYCDSQRQYRASAGAG